MVQLETDSLRRNPLTRKSLREVKDMPRGHLKEEHPQKKEQNMQRSNNESTPGRFPEWQRPAWLQ